MTYTSILKRPITLILIAAVILASYAVKTTIAQQENCGVTPIGTAILDAPIEASGGHKVWVRMMAADADNNAVYLEVDGRCYLVGDNSSITPGEFVWVDYQNGNPNEKIIHNFSSPGTYPVRVIGHEANVGVDMVLFVGDGDDCTPGHTIDPELGYPGTECMPDTTPPPAEDPVINSFDPADTVVAPNEVTTISWNSSNTTNCRITSGGQTLLPTGGSTGEYVTNPLVSDATFTLTCSNADGAETSANTTVTVSSEPQTPGQPNISNFSTDKSTVGAGESVTLSWSSTNATACVIDPPGDQTEDRTGEKTVVINSSETFTLTCFNEEGEASETKSVSVTVQQPQPQPQPQPAPSPRPPAPPPSRNITSQTKQPTVTASNGDKIKVAGNNDKASGNTVLDPTLVLDQNKAKKIVKVEYYANGRFVHTDTTEPFALDTKLLQNGQYEITEKVYFQDGSTQTRTSTVRVDNGDDSLAGTRQAVSDNSRGIKIVGGVIATIIVLGGGGLLVARIIRKRQMDNITHGYDNF